MQSEGSGRYAKTGGGSSRTATTPPTTSGVPTIANAGSPVNSPVSNQRHVQFAGVVVLGSDNGNGGQNQKGPEAAQYQTIDVDDHSGTSTDSEMPLRLMV